MGCGMTDPYSFFIVTERISNRWRGKNIRIVLRWINERVNTLYGTFFFGQIGEIQNIFDKFYPENKIEVINAGLGSSSTAIEIKLINHEKIIRDDHSLQFRYIYKCVNEKLDYEVSFFEIKRVINWNIFEIIDSFRKNKTFFDVINTQMSDVISEINNKDVKKVYLGEEFRM